MLGKELLEKPQLLELDGITYNFLLPVSHYLHAVSWLLFGDRCKDPDSIKTEEISLSNILLAVESILRQLRTLTDFRPSIPPFGQCSLTLKPWGNKTLMQSGIMSARSSNIIKYLGNDSRIAPLLLAVLTRFIDRVVQ